MSENDIEFVTYCVQKNKCNIDYSYTVKEGKKDI